MADSAAPTGIAEGDFAALAAFAREKGVALTVVGPEAPLVGGIADFFAREGLPIFGPTAAAAAIEGSKSFAKGLMERHGIPTAAYEAFSDYRKARRHVEGAPLPIVIKADGLAAGKGVAVAGTREEALGALDGMMAGGRFGDAGRTVVVEEFLEGEEFSLIAFASGEDVIPMPLARDHKRALDGDRGPNTGGMGAYSPVPQIAESVAEAAAEQILRRAARALASEGRGFTGFLYAGLIATKEGPKAIEFNARLGDPEAQVLLPRLESDLFETISAAMRGESPRPEWSADAALGVTLAARGYPGAHESGFPIEGLDSLDSETMAFHGGTEARGGKIVASGGRVLVVARKARTLGLAREGAYAEVAKLRCEGLFCRSDIGLPLTGRENPVA